MSQRLPAFTDRPEVSYPIELDGRTYRVTLRWSERRIGWYLDVATEAGRRLVSGRRLCPGESPLAGLVDMDAPPGLLLVLGPDGYGRDDLGGSLRLTYVSAADLPEPAPSPYRVTT